MDNLHANICKFKYREAIFLTYRYLFLRAQKEPYNMYRLLYLMIF